LRCSYFFLSLDFSCVFSSVSADRHDRGAAAVRGWAARGTEGVRGVVAAPGAEAVEGDSAVLAADRPGAAARAEAGKQLDRRSNGW